MERTKEQRIERIMTAGFTLLEATMLVEAEDARDAALVEAVEAETEAPKFTKLRAGYYVAAGGRYELVALSGWYRGTWVLFDKEDRSRREFGSKREALAAMMAGTKVAA